VRSVIFALNTDLAPSGSSEVDRYRDVYANDLPYLRALCVVGRGYWYEDGQKWCNYKTTGELGEVLAFIGGVTNTYRSISRSRGDPKLGNYIIPDTLGVQWTATMPGQSVVVQVRPASQSEADDAAQAGPSIPSE
jgi:hypothetical protein